jgi:branched-chain amino acid transport system ATP-binding protein
VAKWSRSAERIIEKSIPAARNVFARRHPDHSKTQTGNILLSALTLTHMSKSFGALKVANDASLVVQEGEALGIIGPNGAGKSTLFNLINGTVMADAGSISLFGRDVTRLPAMERVRLGVGRSFQIPQPFDKLSVFENLLVAASFGQNKHEHLVEADCVRILDQTNLIHRANMLAGSLPLLDRKRLELARAMATGPRILLLDEIAGGLTDAECKSLIATIKAIHASGITIVWIEHVLHAVTSVVERLVVLDFGRIIADGKPDDVMAMQSVKEIYLGVDV